MEYVSLTCNIDAYFGILIWKLYSQTAQFDMDNSISVGISSGILNQQSAPVNIPSSLSNSLGRKKYLLNHVNFIS